MQARSARQSRRQRDRAYQIQRTELLAVNVEPDDPTFPLIRPAVFDRAAAAVVVSRRRSSATPRNDAVNPTSGVYFSVERSARRTARSDRRSATRSRSSRRRRSAAVAGSSGIVLAGSARLGMAAEFDLENPIPEPERFFAGGDTDESRLLARRARRAPRAGRPADRHHRQERISDRRQRDRRAERRSCACRLPRRPERRQFLRLRGMSFSG